jgi:phosphoribosylformylglycinamidine (FGAM) synthase-like enzyme
MVRTNTLVLAGMGAGVVRVKGTNRAPRAVGRRQRPLLLPRSAPRAQLAVAEAARNVACAGALPIGATNCLNFGNPERPEIMWQLVEAVEGIAEACRALDIPITGGNVSLYNETDGQAIYPTPILGVVGLLEDASRVLTRSFRAPGDEVVLLGESRGELGGSEYLKAVHGVIQGSPPRLDLERERRAHRAAGLGGGGRAAPVRARLRRRRPGGGARGVRVRHRRDRAGGAGPAGGRWRPCSRARPLPACRPCASGVREDPACGSASPAAP